MTNQQKERQICTTEKETWSCSNMRSKQNDTDLCYEHYKCVVCGRTMKLDYEEMK